MNTIKKYLERLISQKPGFWFFQIAGWSLFMLMDFIVSYDEITKLMSPLFWALSFIVGILISLLLRYCYRRLFFKRPGKFNIYMIAATIPLFSLLAAAFWAAIRLVLLNPLELLYLHEIPFKISLPPVNLFLYLTEVANYAWPYLIWSALYFGIKFWIDLLEANELSQKASLLAQKSQLQMLRYQLNPHFLFNSLNSIQALIYDDPNHADRMITELSDFLRFTLRDKDRLFIPLGEEVKIVEKYLSMEKTRFPDRLDYSINVTDQASKIEVIAFILQPFVENAIKHGMKSSPEKLDVMISGSIKARHLFIEVRNNGQWIENHEVTGTGIKNVYDRLNNAYPNKYDIQIKKNPDFVSIVIEIVF